MADSNKIYVASYCTESSDRGVVGYWTKKPTEKQLRKYFQEIMPDEFLDAEEGKRRKYDCLVHWNVEELCLQHMK